MLTRDPADVAAYAAQLAPRGIEAIAMPVTRWAPAADPGALARALATGPFEAIVVLSARGAAALARVLARTTAPIWAVGPATLQALAGAELEAYHPPAVRDGAGLAHALVASGITGRVLVPRADEGRTDAIDILRAADLEVVDVAAYRTVTVDANDPALAPGRVALAEGAVCGVFAPSQVTALAALLGPLDRLTTRFCAIGETTAAALRAAGIEPRVAAAPTPEAFATALAALCSPAA